MDTELARTFLTVIAAGNFISAARGRRVSDGDPGDKIPVRARMELLAGDRPRDCNRRSNGGVVRSLRNAGERRLFSDASRKLPTLVFLLYQKGRDDYTVKSGPQRVRDLMGEEAEALLRHRFEIVTTPLTRLKAATIVAIPNNQQVTADEDRGRLVRRP